VIRRLYVHNFRCLDNFELLISRRSSALLIGKNGTGKTAIRLVLEILQRIARGTNRVGELVKPKDFSWGRTHMPMRLEIEVDLGGKIYAYSLALELPAGFRELRVLEEKLTVGTNVVYTREPAKVALLADDSHSLQRMASAGTFPIDWHLVALPIIQRPLKDDPLNAFKEWLARALILRPMPSSIEGESKDETLEPNVEVTNFGAWFSGLLAYAPSAYATIDHYLKQLMPDLKDIKNPVTGTDSRSLIVQFSQTDRGSVSLPFADLSDGEKCFMVCALVLAANDAYGPVFCFWDEPDTYLALSEVGHFVTALRTGFHSTGQFIATSHNPEAISRFSNENTFALFRRNHLEPTTVRTVDEVQFSGDLVGALIRDDLEP
jgi:energy-coupling factor transporter ATP-binding protein EcfA2